MVVEREGLAEFFSVVMPLLDERQRRVVAGATASDGGPWWDTAVAEAASMSRNTVIAGTREIETGRRRVGIGCAGRAVAASGDRQGPEPVVGARRSGLP